MASLWRSNEWDKALSGLTKVAFIERWPSYRVASIDRFRCAACLSVLTSALVCHSVVQYIDSFKYVQKRTDMYTYAYIHTTDVWLSHEGGLVQCPNNFVRQSLMHHFVLYMQNKYIPTHSRVTLT